LVNEADQAVAHPMQRLDVELLLALELDEAHGGSGRRFGDSFGIAIVILLGLDVRAHVLRRNQPDLVPQRRQRPAHVMGATACFHRHRAGGQLCGQRDHSIATHPPPHNDCTAFVQSDDTAAVLAQIDAKDHYAHGPFLPLLNTDILHRRRQEGGRAIHKGGLVIMPLAPRAAGERRKSMR
jgi:hypothetical protein